VAVNLRGVATTDVSRGDALVALSWPDPTRVVDVTGPSVGARLPRTLTLHVGTAALPVRTQRLTDGTIRLRLPRPAPLVPGDRAVLRDPGLREVLAGVEVAVVDPPTRHERRERQNRLERQVRHERGDHPERGDHGDHGDDRDRERAGAPGPPGPPDGIPALLEWLAAHPVQAPSRDLLDDWKLTPRDLADAAARGQIVRVGGLVLAGDVLEFAEQVVRRLPQPFAVGEASRELGTSRRVTVPLLERLDSAMVTRRLPDGRREVRGERVTP
jgi:selenocysteine-specific elongation factor